MVDCGSAISKFLVFLYCVQTGFLLKLIIEKSSMVDVKVDYPMHLVKSKELKKCRQDYDKARLDLCQSAANYLIKAELLMDSFNLDRICYLGGRHMDCVGKLLYSSKDPTLQEYRSVFSLICQRDCQNKLECCKGLRYPKKGDCRLYNCVTNALVKCSNRSAQLIAKYSYLKDLCLSGNETLPANCNGKENLRGYGSFIVLALLFFGLLFSSI